MRRKAAAIVYFRFDSHELGEDVLEGLQGQASVIINNPEFRFSVTGHTDRVGSDAYNMELGMRRAERVVAALVAMGVPEEQLLAQVSMGEDQTAIDTEVPEMANRRVYIEILGPMPARAVRLVLRDDDRSNAQSRRLQPENEAPEVTSSPGTDPEQPAPISEKSEGETPDDEVLEDETRGHESPEDETPEDETSVGELPEGEFPEDVASEDETPQGGATEDAAPKVEATESGTSDDAAPEDIAPTSTPPQESGTVGSNPGNDKKVGSAGETPNNRDEWGSGDRGRSR